MSFALSSAATATNRTAHARDSRTGFVFMSPSVGRFMQPPMGWGPHFRWSMRNPQAGGKITEYCDQNQLTTQQRLDLFIKVCQAIQHAHQKGIIHVSQ